MPLVDVALPIPLPRTFTYRSDESLQPGTRVRVPFGGRKLIGWVIGEAIPPKELNRLKDVEKVLDVEPSVPHDVLELCRWIADYYVTPVGMVLRGALPVALSNMARTASPELTRRVVRIVKELPSLTLRDEVFGRALRQRELYELLESLGGQAETVHITETQGFTAGVLKGLVEKGVAEIATTRVERDPFAEMAV